MKRNENDNEGVSAGEFRGDTLSWIIQRNVWNVEKNIVCFHLHAADKLVSY